MNWKLISVLFGIVLIQSELSHGNSQFPYSAEKPRTGNNSLRLGFSAIRCHSNLISTQPDVPLSFFQLPGFSAGVSLYQDLGKNFSLESGVLVSKRGYRTDHITFLPPESFHAELVENDNPYLTQTEIYSIDQYHFVDVPLILSYRKHFKKLSVELGAGGSAGFRLNESSTAYNYSTSEHFKNYNSSMPDTKVQWRFIARLGLEYMVSDYFSVRLDPIFQQDIVEFEPIYDFVANSSGATGRMYSYGLKIGLISNLSFKH